MLKKSGKTAAADILIFLGAAVNLAAVAGIVLFYLLS